MIRFSLSAGLLLMSACAHAGQSTQTTVQSNIPKIGMVARSAGTPSSASTAGLEHLTRALESKDDLQFLESSDHNDDVGRLQLLATQRYATIIAVGTEMAPAVARVARTAPTLAFVLIDGYADGPNINSVGIDDAKPAFLSGSLAAIVAKGRPIALVDNLGEQRRKAFEAAFASGAAYAERSAKPAIVEVDSPAALASAVRKAGERAGSLTIASGTAAAQALEPPGGRVPLIAYGFESHGALATAPDALVVAAKVSIEQARAQKIPSGPSLVDASDGLALRLNAAAPVPLTPAQRARFDRISAGLADGSIAPAPAPGR